MGQGIQTGCTLIFAFIAIIWEGCCLEVKDVHYRVVEGDPFKMPCSLDRHSKGVVWTRSGGGHGCERPSKDSTRQEQHASGCVISRHNDLEFPAVKSTHSGNYTCRINGSGRLLLHLQVLNKANLGCYKSDESQFIVLRDIGKIPCPIFNCSDQDSNTNVKWWYKGYEDLPKSRYFNKHQCPKGNLCLQTVDVKDNGTVHFCDRRTEEQGIIWNNRRAVNVTVISSDTKEGPRCILPQNKEQEVELGRPYTLICKVHFGFERNFSPLVQWYGSCNQDGEDCMLLNQTEGTQQERGFTTIVVTKNSTIEEVTQQNMNCYYKCLARNKVGNCSATIKLKEKTRVNVAAVVVFAIVPLLLVAGLGITVYIKWVEVSLLYRIYVLRIDNGEHEKEFDAFVSFVWSSASEKIGGRLSTLSSSRPGFDDQTTQCRLFTIDHATQRPLEVLLPATLEDQWGYSLYLLDRDPLPGEAYTHDVVHGLKISRMLICLLSVDYLSDSNAVFVLESGIQAFLQDSNFKLLLIWTEERPASLGQLEPPLPPLVWRALRVLPALDWASAVSEKAISNFWKTLRKTMPVKSAACVNHTQ